MPMINIEDAYILDNTGKQVDDAVDYALANSNRNLLDNPWWGSGEVVNQRGITGTPANQAYCIDRWIYSTGSGSNAISLGANGITFTPISGQYMWMEQHMANASWFTGKTVTGSIMLADGTIYSGTVKVTTGNDYMYVNDSVGFRFYLDASNNIVLRVGTTKTIRALKVELGSYSTLANDVPPDYGEELRKCRRYFRRYAPKQTGLALIGRAASTTEADFILGDEPMAKSTGITAAINGAVYARAGDNTNHSVTSAVVQTSIGGGPALICATTGLTLGATAVIVFASGGYIDINGDL